MTLLEIVDDRWLCASISTLPGATLTPKPEWDALTLTVNGKMFALHCEDPRGNALLTLKGKPEDNEALRHEYAEVIPGYYCNKTHWNSVLLETAPLAEEHLRELLEESYRLVFASLTKKAQREIAAAH